jgi:hypothetical protein
MGRFARLDASVMWLVSNRHGGFKCEVECFSRSPRLLTPKKVDQMYRIRLQDV